LGSGLLFRRIELTLPGRFEATEFTCGEAHSLLVFRESHSCCVFSCVCAAEVLCLVFGYRAPNSSHARHCYRLRCSGVMWSSRHRRPRTDRDERSDERVTNWVFVLPRGHPHQRLQPHMVSSGDGWNGTVRYYPSHCDKKATGRLRSALLAAACFSI
jgi:hypothetical protein